MSEMLKTTKALLASGSMDRDTLLRNFQLMLESGPNPDAQKSYDYVKNHKRCRKCQEVKKISNFRNEDVYYCNDCKVESKKSYFFQLPESKSQLFEEFCTMVGSTTRDVASQWVEEQLARLLDEQAEKKKSPSKKKSTKKTNSRK